MGKKVEDRIPELIQMIERNRSTLFRRFDVFRGPSFYFLFAAVAVYAFVYPFLIFGTASGTDKIVVALSLMAVVVALFSLLAQFGTENTVDVNYRRLRKSVEEDDRPLLKALIKIKTKHQEFSLEQIYNQNKSMFTKRKLLELLYEHD